MAKILKSAIEKRIIDQANNREVTKGEIAEAMLRQFKKETKRNNVLENYNMHRYFLSKKEKRIMKSKINKKSGK